MFAAHSQTLHELFRDQQLLPVPQLDALDLDSQASGKPFADRVLDLGFLDRPTLLSKIADALGCEVLADLPEYFPTEIVALIPGKIARDYAVMPWRATVDGIDLLIADPFNACLVGDLTFALGRRVHVFLADPDKLQSRIRRYYAEETGSELGAALQDISSGEFIRDETAWSPQEIEAVAEQPPIIRFVNLVLGQAIRGGASDIHFEPFEFEFKIRYRIDGVLFEMAPPPRQLALPVTSRVKVLANLNIAERRVPQDGRIRITLAGRQVDLRVSTLPTQFGESVVLRVLDQSAVQLDLTQLGMPPDVLAGVTEMVHRPNGIFVVTGPTGSGKTTTLYSGLRLINTPDLKILTAEDPVEYEIEGIMQVPVNPLVGMTFASALRSFLRQDPDVIMVGEIRDLETAQISIQASLTGHLVLSTLHTNDAVGAVIRLIDLGVEPFLVASALEVVLAQRLLRRVCPECKSVFEPSQSLVDSLGFLSATPAVNYFFRGRGCTLCGETGFKGRLGIYESLCLNEAMRAQIVERTSVFALRQKAIEQGMRTLRDDALRALFGGLTTIEEVIKYT